MKTHLQTPSFFSLKAYAYIVADWPALLDIPFAPHLENVVNEFDVCNFSGSYFTHPVGLNSLSLNHVSVKMTKWNVCEGVGQTSAFLEFRR